MSKLPPYLLQRLQNEAARRGIALPKQKAAEREPPAPYPDWLASRWSGDAPLAERHHRVYKWFDELKPGERPAPLKEVWPRGGAKSTTVQRGTARAGLKGSRKFCLYITGTQDQADAHVQSVASILEGEGVGRMLNTWGQSRGWRTNLVRTDIGFSIAGIGLDAARRGFKLDDLRPDLIVVDDVDELHDTPRTTKKKLEIITRSLLPTGSVDAAAVYIQNLVSDTGIMSKVVDGTSEFLLDHVPSPVVPAIVGLEYEAYTHEDGRTRFRITKGEPTWEGQNLAVCEAQINAWGIRAFLQEAQHEVHMQSGYFFDHRLLSVVTEIPRFVRLVRAWDFAATQGGGDYTVGVLMGLAPNGTLWVLDVVRAQLESSNAQRLLEMVARWDAVVWGKKVTQLVPQDPGAAGKRVAEEQLGSLSDYSAEAAVVVGKKGQRAKPWQRTVNEGNARVLKDGRPRNREIDEFLERMLRGTHLEGKHLLWNSAFISEHRLFAEDESHDYDDQVDPSADAARELLGEDEAPVVVYSSRPDPRPDSW